MWKIINFFIIIFGVSALKILRCSPINFQHSDYKISHHMGRMKINATPDGANFDFSGGELDVVLHPAHTIVKPVYHFKRVEKNVKNFYPVLEHRTIEEIQPNHDRLKSTQYEPVEISSGGSPHSEDAANFNEESESGEMREYFEPHEGRKGYHNFYYASHGDIGTHDLGDDGASINTPLSRTFKGNDFRPVEDERPVYGRWGKQRNPVSYFQRLRNVAVTGEGRKLESGSMNGLKSRRLEDVDTNSDLGSTIASVELQRPPEGDVDDFTKKIYPNDAGSGSPTTQVLSTSTNANYSGMQDKGLALQQRYKHRHHHRRHHRHHYHLPSVIIVKEQPDKTVTEPSQAQQKEQTNTVPMRTRQDEETKSPTLDNNYGESLRKISRLAGEQPDLSNDQFDKGLSYVGNNLNKHEGNNYQLSSNEDEEETKETIRGPKGDDAKDEDGDKGLVIDIVGDEDHDDTNQVARHQDEDSYRERAQDDQATNRHYVHRQHDDNNYDDDAEDPRAYGHRELENTEQVYNRHMPSRADEDGSNSRDDNESDNDDSAEKSTIIINRSKVLSYPKSAVVRSISNPGGSQVTVNNRINTKKSRNHLKDIFRQSFIKKTMIGKQSSPMSLKHGPFKELQNFKVGMKRMNISNNNQLMYKRMANDFKMKDMLERDVNVSENGPNSNHGQLLMENKWKYSYVDRLISALRKRELQETI